MKLFKLGDIHTYERWNRPTLPVFKQWLKQWRELHPTSDPYDVYLIGCAAEKWYGDCELDTWDVDILVKGTPHNYQKLSTMMRDAVRLGFENRLFIDIFWLSWTYSSEVEEIPHYEQIRFYKQTHLENRAGVVKTYDLDWDNNAKELPYGLYTFYRTTGSKSLSKVQARIKSGEYKHIHVNLKDIE